MCLLIAWMVSIAPAGRSANELDVEAAAIAAARLKDLGPAYTATIDHQRRLVYLSSLDPTHLAQTMDLLARYADAYHRTLGGTATNWNVTIILPTANDYGPMAPAVNVTGFYAPAKRTIISIDRGRVLLHEFTHALHHADQFEAQQIHPIWITEGLATLFESAEITPDGLICRVDGRLATLQQAIRDKTVLPLEKLLELDRDKFIKNAPLCYAESRYLMLYLRTRGVLREWYEAYKTRYADDPTGREALESVLGQPVSRLDKPWRKWVEQLRIPACESNSIQGRLGAVLRDGRDGVKIVALTAGSAAARANRLQVGDIIEEFNGRKIRCSAGLIGAVRAAVAMQTAEIKVLRRGHRITIRQPLGAGE